MGGKPSISDNVMFYAYERETKEGIKHTVYILDDKNIPGNTLAERRIHMLKNGVLLKKIRHAIFFLGDMIKLATFSTWFIDSKGLLFNVKKARKADLTCVKIKRIIPIQSGGAILELVGSLERHKVLHLPDVGVKYAGILKYGMSNILYGVYNEPFEKTHRYI